ncbi:IclR family transcriptional regulator [Alteromonas pelagimontana]|uniref:IclR family transcriptional regulator n=1 Tax=Alteromonas pelagimontana TaxID=1858656 RepID=A0A6M4MJJ9_9ALTE|nr:IclR family transcriptional regulator [Alteromonas pelagimontana]QJR82276.1 IclR family transcriptional regulator [Alteromonas pelagimontana]
MPKIENQPQQGFSDKDRRESASSEKAYTAPALEKGLDIIELLAGSAEGFKLKEMANQLEKSVSEIFRMVCVLERRGYIQLDEETDKYRLSLKLFDVAHAHSPIKTLTEVAVAELDSLTKIVGQSCHLSVRNGMRAVVVAQKDSPMDKLITIRLGASASLLNSCSGHIFIAFTSRSDHPEIFKEIEKEMSPQALKSLIDVVKNQGYERMLSRQIQGVEDIGFPIFGRDRKLIACLVVPYIHYLGGLNTLDINTTIEEVRNCAHRIAIKLGATNQ